MTKEQPILTTEDFARMNEQLSKLGDANLAELLEYEQTAVKLTADEVYRMYAIHAHNICYKYPSGQISRPAASFILGVLNKMTDEALADEYVGLRRYITGTCQDLPSTMGRLVEILCRRRGLGSLIDERQRSMSAPTAN
jgi:hypothetical protein